MLLDAARFFSLHLCTCLLWSKQATHTVSCYLKRSSTCLLTYHNLSWTMPMSMLRHLYLIELENTSTSLKLIWIFELWMLPPSCYRCTVSFEDFWSCRTRTMAGWLRLVWLILAQVGAQDGFDGLLVPRRFEHVRTIIPLVLATFPAQTSYESTMSIKTVIGTLLACCMLLWLADSWVSCAVCAVGLPSRQEVRTWYWYVLVLLDFNLLCFVTLITSARVAI